MLFKRMCKYVLEGSIRDGLEVLGPSAEEQEGSCVISHSTALTSPINSSPIVITCFQDVALPL